MKIYKIILASLIVLVISISMVSAEDVNETDNVLSAPDEGNFIDLNNDVHQSGSIELTKDYKFNPQTDGNYKKGIMLPDFLCKRNPDENQHLHQNSCSQFPVSEGMLQIRMF